MKFESSDITVENIEKIAALFPSAVTESSQRGSKSLRKAINFDMLRTILGDVIADDEAYEFTWVGKKEAVMEAGRPIRKTLRPCVEESKNWDTTENLYIEGDNLDALKLFQESYLGKVKMIYIDPPYNTGNDFVYRDNFTQNKEEYEEEAGVYDEDGDRLFRNTESNGRFHSDWCSMIYPRLVLARNLLRDDGVIFISIDDNEVHNLRKICDEIFGITDFVCEFIVSSNSAKNNSKYVSVSHEYILCYAKQKDKLGEDWKVQKNNVGEYRKRATALITRGLLNDEIHEELLELVKYPRFYDFDHYTYVDDRGVYRTDNSGGVTNGNMATEIIHPFTGKVCAIPSGGWRYKEDELLRKVQDNEIAFGVDETTIPTVKRYLKDYLIQTPKSTLFFDSQGSTKWLKKEKIPFDFPKSVEFIKYLIGMLIQGNEIVLDFFSGSSTTAHAVMQLNSEDNGNRKFIMVQLPEITDETSEACKAGYKNICEIGKERIRRAGEKIKEENKDKEGIENLDIGFRVLKLDDSNMKDVYYSAGEYKQSMLFDMESNIKEDRTDLDLLYGCLLDWGLPLSLSHVHEEIDSVTIHTYNDGDLIACFAEKISENVVKEIAKRQPLRVVFRDSSFSSSPAKINVEEIFKLMSPNTTVKVI